MLTYKELVEAVHCILPEEEYLTVEVQWRRSRHTRYTGETSEDHQMTWTIYTPGIGHQHAHTPEEALVLFKKAVGGFTMGVDPEIDESLEAVGEPKCP